MKLVTYKTAEMAREYGFNEKTLKSYSINNPTAEPITYGELMQWNETSNNIAAPNQTELQTWLHENHNIHVYVMAWNAEWQWNVQNIIMCYNGPSGNNITYYLAMEDGLQAALNNL